MSGMDLHGVELYISNLINNSKEFRETKTVILDLAYYTFNHDNCCTKKAINLMKRMAIYEKFDDWGSYCENSDAQTRIVQYNALKKIVGKKYESTATSISNNYMSSDIINEANETFIPTNIWTKIHSNTISDNEVRIERILKMLESINAKVYFIILPMYHVFNEKNHFIIQKHRKMLYKRIDLLSQKYKFEIIDYNFENTFPSNCFYNVNYMNYLGAIKLTNLVKKQLHESKAIESKYTINYSVFQKKMELDNLRR